MSSDLRFDDDVPWYGGIGDPPQVQEPEDPAYTDHPGGIDATTGKLLVEKVELSGLVERVFGLRRPEALDESQQGRGRALPPDFEPGDLSQTGWGVIVRKGGGDEALRGLDPLLERRREQAKWMFRKFEYEPGESARQFLSRHNLGPDVVDPEVVPYYLLIAGSPEEVPFSLQYQLGIGYGVGRLHFDDAAGYANYAAGLLRSEENGPRRAPAVSLFSAETDETTERTTSDMIGPLVTRLIRPGEAWSVRTAIRTDATKERLQRLCGSGETPTVLVTASHGAAYPASHEMQGARQGALLCAGWPGPGTPPEDHELFTAADVPDDADVQGLVCAFFSCHSAATPDEDNFPHEEPGRRRLAPESFIAALPQRLLGHPAGGALGVIGHVDRAWTTTAIWNRRGGQVQTLAAVLRQILLGRPIGHAMTYFGQRHAWIAAQLSEVWDQVNRGGDRPNDDFFAWLLTAHNDARNLILLGDPAARVPVAAASSGA